METCGVYVWPEAGSSRSMPCIKEASSRGPLTFVDTECSRRCDLLQKVLEQTCRGRLMCQPSPRLFCLSPSMQNYCTIGYPETWDRTRRSPEASMAVTSS